MTFWNYRIGNPLVFTSLKNAQLLIQSTNVYNKKFVRQSFLYGKLHYAFDHIWSYMIIGNPLIITSPKNTVHLQQYLLLLLVVPPPQVIVPPRCSTLITIDPLDCYFILSYTCSFSQLFHPSSSCSSSQLFCLNRGHHYKFFFYSQGHGYCFMQGIRK